jgi:hypothetical protein
MPPERAGARSGVFCGEKSILSQRREAAKKDLFAFFPPCPRASVRAYGFQLEETPILSRGHGATGKAFLDLFFAPWRLGERSGVSCEEKSILSRRREVRRFCVFTSLRVSVSPCLRVSVRAYGFQLDETRSSHGDTESQGRPSLISSSRLGGLAREKACLPDHERQGRRCQARSAVDAISTGCRIRWRGNPSSPGGPRRSSP